MRIYDNTDWGVNRGVGVVVYRSVDGKVNMWLEEVLVNPLVAG